MRLSSLALLLVVVVGLSTSHTNANSTDSLRIVRGDGGREPVKVYLGEHKAVAMKRHAKGGFVTPRLVVLDSRLSDTEGDDAARWPLRVEPGTRLRLQLPDRTFHYPIPLRVTNYVRRAVAVPRRIDLLRISEYDPDDPLHRKRKVRDR